MLELPQRKYSIIYADPPWHYDDKSLSHGGGAESHYPTMRTKDICELPIRELSDDDSILVIWTTYPQLEEVFKVINAWGFKYKTCLFTWVKTNSDGSYYMGMGRYTRSNPELCLLATKRNGIKRVRKDIPNLTFYKRSEHSRKPPFIKSLIVSLFGDLPRIELFCRQRYEGWDAWGNQLSEDIQTTIKAIDSRRTV